MRVTFGFFGVLKGDWGVYSTFLQMGGRGTRPRCVITAGRAGVGWFAFLGNGGA